MMTNDSMREEVRLLPRGQWYVNGISSSYESVYNPVLVGIITEEELRDIISRLNQTLHLYWPCTVVYCTGFICAPFTCGASLVFGPQLCISEAETHATRLLEQVSLRSKYFDRDIKFELKKERLRSYVSVSFPATKESELSPLIAPQPNRRQLSSKDNGAGETENVLTDEPCDYTKSHLKFV
jgi:hypothetical protein